MSKLSLSTSNKLVQFVFIVLIAVDSIKCIEIPSTDFLPPFVSSESKNQINDELDNNSLVEFVSTTLSPPTTTTYVTPVRRITTPLPRTNAPNRQKTRTRPPIKTTTAQPRTTRRLQQKTRPPITPPPTRTLTTSPPRFAKLQQQSQTSTFQRYSGPTTNDANAQILKQVKQLDENGVYEYQFETDNGIQAEERGFPKDLGNGNIAEQVAGSYRYTAPDGQVIQVIYTADENGFHPTGDHLPTPPPIPEAILRALKYIEEHSGRKQ